MTAGLGQMGEDLAADYYRKLGFKVVGRNYFFRRGKQTGELDLICVKDKQLVFVEVKTRSSARFGSPLEAVDAYKQHRLIRTAKLFMATHPQYQNFDFRIDVASVDVDNNLQPVIIYASAIEDEV